MPDSLVKVLHLLVTSAFSFLLQVYPHLLFLSFLQASFPATSISFFIFSQLPLTFLQQLMASDLLFLLVDSIRDYLIFQGMLLVMIHHYLILHLIIGSKVRWSFYCNQISRLWNWLQELPIWHNLFNSHVPSTPAWLNHFISSNL